LIARKLLTLDANVFVAALKMDEEYSDECSEILGKVPKDFILAEPSVVYIEVVGTLARKTSSEVAVKAEKTLGKMVNPLLIDLCDEKFCLEASKLCSKYGVYAIDALYLATAIYRNAVLTSLDKENFTDRIKERKPPIEVYHVSEFPY